MKSPFWLMVALALLGTALVGCSGGDISQGDATSRQKEIEEGNKKLGNVEGTQE